MQNGIYIKPKRIDGIASYVHSFNGELHISTFNEQTKRE